ncbi:hypothetical protein FQR65_LT00910 [Abscondita terminalis]|nr:hypothetical protein FQR65_LT00910 [Abscondita terminalis]
MDVKKTTIPRHLQKLIEEMLTNLKLKPQRLLNVSLPINPGANYLGDMFYITAIAKNNEEQVVSLDLIAKSAPTSKLYRQFLSIQSAYEREIFMYTTVVPELMQIQKDNRINNIFNPFPKYYGSTHTTPETILLENMKNEYQPDVPTDLCLLDLQISSMGSPCLDIAFFIWISTSKKFRDRHYEELLQMYYSSFSQFLRELGGCPEKAFPMEVFKEHLKIFSVFGLFTSIWLVSLNITKTTDSPTFQCIDSLNSIFDRFSVISNDKYYEIIRDILEDFIKLLRMDVEKDTIPHHLQKLIEEILTKSKLIPQQILDVSLLPISPGVNWLGEIFHITAIATNNKKLKVSLNLIAKSAPTSNYIENFYQSNPLLNVRFSCEEYAVVCHGDSQTKNYLFKYDNQSQPDIPTDLCFLDLQVSRMGSPCLDIAFFIWVCTTKEFRDRHYEELLQIYYSSFSQFLRELGGCPEKSFTVNVFKEHLKIFSVFGLFASIWLVSLNITKATDLPTFQTIDDLKTISDRFSVVSNEKYFEIIRDTLEDFIKYDYDF